MNERERAQDPAEGPDDPAVYEPEETQPDEDSDAAALDEIAEAMPGAGRLNEDPDNPGTSDPDLRTNGPAPLP